MGDRANICIVEDNVVNGYRTGLFFYTHSGGYRLPQVLQDALKRGQDRWGDSSYLSRIIFSEMIKDSVLNLTGYGISGFLTDNEHPILVVDLKSQTIGLSEVLRNPKTFGIINDTPQELLDNRTNVFSFQDFIKLSPASWEVMSIPQ